MTASLLKTNSPKTFLRERSGLRIGTAATDKLIAVLTEAAELICDHAKQQAEADERSTLMERDIEAGLERYLQSSGPSLLSPATLHQALDGLDNEELAEVIKLLLEETR